MLVHGTLRTDGQRLHNGTVLTVTAIAEDSLRAVDNRGAAVTLPRPFIEGHRGDGSPNVSHAWARTVDGVQAGTWTQVHLLGTAALERFTGYTGQSRSRHATHTWNVTRLPDIDHGGVLADQRTPDREVLDALLRVPDTGFATHDDPGHIRHLVAERAEHEAILAGAPRDRSRELSRAARDLQSSEQELHWANHRLDAARDRLDRVGPLCLLRHQGRREKRAILDDIERFEGDVTRSTAKVSARQRQHDRLEDEVAQSDAWHVENDWRHQRVATIEAELTDLGHIDLSRVPLSESHSGMERDRSRTSALSPSVGTTGRPGFNDVPEWWADRHPEIVAPPLPCRDAGLGMDLGP